MHDPSVRSGIHFSHIGSWCAFRGGIWFDLLWVLLPHSKQLS
jgi:hypothetical protein